MSIAVGVILRKIKDKIYADAGHFILKLNDKIVLETEHGIEVGKVCEKQKNVQKGKGLVCKVLRKLTEKDEIKIFENEKKSLKAHGIVAQKVNNYRLDMKLTCVHYIFDRSKLFIYYTSETRVDFRELVKDLGHILKTRIQMVQIGVRDESKIIGGIGTCGQILCCKNFLKDFNSVTIDMAKKQDLSLNTTKLSGLCGRLMCCISYENNTYKNIKKEISDIGTFVLTPDGRAKLTAIDCIRENVTVEFDDGSLKIFGTEQVINSNKKEDE